MPTRDAKARWEGTLKDGKGTMTLPAGGFEGPFTRASRFEQGEGTNPEELIGAAHAGCFSMFLAALLSKAGYEPSRIETTAHVTVEQTDDGPAITKIVLDTAADVADLDDSEFQDTVAEAKKGCPVSKALAAVGDISVNATLNG